MDFGLLVFAEEETGDFETQKTQSRIQGQGFWHGGCPTSLGGQPRIVA